MSHTTLTITRKITLFLVLLVIMLIEFVFALALAYYVLMYLSAVMDLAQLPAAPGTPIAPK